MLSDVWTYVCTYQLRSKKVRELFSLILLQRTETPLSVIPCFARCKDIKCELTRSISAICTVVSSLQLCRRGRERSTDSRYLLKRRTVAMAIITSVEASVLAMSRDCKVWLTCSIAATCSPPWCPILLPRKDRYWTEELSCMAWHSRLAPCSVRSLHPRSTLCTGQAAFCRTRKHATITLC